jgi:hypothetical protein
MPNRALGVMNKLYLVGFSLNSCSYLTFITGVSIEIRFQILDQTWIV